MHGTTRTIRHPSFACVLAVSSLLLAVRTTDARAQDAPPLEQSMPGFAAPHAAAQRALVVDVVRLTSAYTARARSRALSAETHVAGTPAQLRTRDYVMEQMQK